MNKTITFILFLGFAVLLFSTNSVVGKNNDTLLSCSDSVVMDTSHKSYYARSGCCSHHRGVCGCAASGKQQCCDGSESKSCVCRY